MQVDPQGFVVAVDRGPGDRFASQTRAADTGDDGRDDLIPKGEQCGDGAGRIGWDVVAAGSPGFVDEVFPADLAQVVGGVPGAVVVGGLPGMTRTCSTN